MRLAVITSTIGERSALLTPKHYGPGDGIRYLAFSDRAIRSDCWEVIRVDRKFCDPCRDAKRFKTLAHEHVADVDGSIWIDRAARLVVDPRELFESFDEDVLFVKHFRRCIFAEAKACMKKGKDVPEMIRPMMRRFHFEGWPIGRGLFYATFFARRHNKANERFSNLWNNYIETGSRRDQLSLPVALARSGVSVSVRERREIPDLFKQIGGR
jgi:hypothetical protein